MCLYLFEMFVFLLGVGVIASVFAGHYVADVYNIGQQQWYHYDDEVVSCLTEREVLGSARQRNGYIFCYVHRYRSAVSCLVTLSPYAQCCNRPFWVLGQEDAPIVLSSLNSTNLLSHSGPVFFPLY
jgi:hypothetical protein